MWGFVDCTRYYMSAGRPNVVLFNASLRVETHEKVALLVRPGQGKSTIMRCSRVSTGPIGAPSCAMRAVGRSVMPAGFMPT